MSNPRPSKRQRIYRACDQCRRRKSKCDGEQPVCSICRDSNRTCTYQSGGGRRGLPSGYVRSLEATLGLFLQHIPTSESTVHAILRDSRHGNSLTGDLVDHSVATWRRSKLSRDLPKFLKPGSKSDGSQTTVHDESDSESIEIRDLPSIDARDGPSNSGFDDARPAQYSSNLAADPTQCLDLPLPDNTTDLLDFYFTHTHCWFPILERRDLFRAMHSDSHHSMRDSASRMVLWAVIAYTSAMSRDLIHSKLVDPMQIQRSIRQRIIAEENNQDLAHIQALLILVLLHLGLGNTSRAWVLVGQATRILEILPVAARKHHRFRHTFHGCVFLDNTISALLNRVPCLSAEEQTAHGPVEEDDVDEWDVWAIPQLSRAETRTQKRPLRALSTFNSIQRLMEDLCSILYYTPHAVRVHSLLAELQEKQTYLLDSYPCDAQSTNPPLITLHLASNFNTLSFICRFASVASTVTELALNSLRRTLDMLDLYLEMTGTILSSPFLRCLILQCHRFLAANSASLPQDESNVLESRLSTYLQKLKVADLENDTRFNIFPPQILTRRTEYISPSHQQTQTIPDSSLLNGSPRDLRGSIYNDISTRGTDPHTFSNNPPLPAGDILEPLAGSRLASNLPSTVPGEGENFDALFEELVTSMPATRQEPVFAQNLGFYGGDLDTDFLAQLQQPEH
ncbi:hypothetical protein NUU61_005713 [Penicillium alfredii]|uniref:Zn(2)-C6 fungal-type domain-containing protein n=1 Tax=Penicillium alfredii TaxID=1506179 RepID=A0A9W9F9Y1_9EURO|nr:uncharacterized protein NUU61_005713 [Penicillium alfredii]KAJ5096357.1 hypothetical protein NUU61_005713 [Penicillium alfredii]